MADLKVIATAWQRELRFFNFSMNIQLTLETDG